MKMHNGLMWDLKGDTMKKRHKVPDLMVLLVPLAICCGAVLAGLGHTHAEAKSGSKKPAPVFGESITATITARFHWEQQDVGLHGEPEWEIKGSSTVFITGKFALHSRKKIVERYGAKEFLVSYSYKENAVELEPKKGCPSLLWELSGSGTAPMQEGSMYELIIHKGGSQSNIYEFSLSGAAVKLKGRERVQCQEYGEYFRDVSFGRTSIRDEMGKNGIMRGRRSWSVSVPVPIMGVGCIESRLNHLQKLKSPPCVASCTKGRAGVTVAWNLGDFSCRDVDDYFDCLDREQQKWYECVGKAVRSSVEHTPHASDPPWCDPDAYYACVLEGEEYPGACVRYTCDNLLLPGHQAIIGKLRDNLEECMANYQQGLNECARHCE